MHSVRKIVQRGRIEPWLYRLSLVAIRNLSEHSGDGVDSVHLEDSPRRRSSTIAEGSDEAMLQFHQPDETLTSESVIADTGAATPEESAASDEMVGLVERALLALLNRIARPFSCLASKASRWMKSPPSARVHPKTFAGPSNRPESICKNTYPSRANSKTSSYNTQKSHN